MHMKWNDNSSSIPTIALQAGIEQLFSLSSRIPFEVTFVFAHTEISIPKGCVFI